MRTPIPSVLTVLLALPSLAAQCPLVVTSGGPQPGLTGRGTCSTLWDPDGAGPEPQHLVVGGRGLRGGANGTDERVMTWNGSEWRALGQLGTPLWSVGVNALTVWNGLLVAGGDFTGGGTDRIALWDGAAWQPLGAGFPVTVRALTVWNSQLVAAGYSTSSGVDTPIIRRWNGVTWTSLPTPPLLKQPLALASFGGELLVGGQVLTINQGALERWNGSAWGTSTSANGRINCFAARSFSLLNWLYVGGTFTSIGGVAATRVAATSGGSTFAWGSVGTLTSSVRALHVRSTGALSFDAVVATNHTTTPNFRWNGTGWVPIGQDIGLNSVTYYGGAFHAVTTEQVDVCRRFDGTSWVPLRGPGIDGDVHALAPFGDDVILGGTFTTAGGVTASRIARWDGTSFHTLGPALGGTSVDALLPVDGAIVAGGLFLSAGGTALNHIGRWDGSAWSALGTGFDQQVLALCRLPNGDLIAGGRFATAGGVACARIARWDGSAWSPLGTGMNGDVCALAVRSDGTLFAGGAFTFAGGVACNRVAQWNGTQWLNVGAGCNADVLGLAARPNGDVVAVGTFTSAGGLPAQRCARWTGVAWNSMGAASTDVTTVRAVLALPDGDVVVGHGFHTPTGLDEGLSRWDGSAWSGLVTLGGYTDGISPAVRTLAQAADGSLVVGGAFTLAGSVVARNLASIASDCLPAAVPYGTGCSSAAGPLVLTADALPWIGAPFRTTTSGNVPLSICVGVIGFTPLSLPLDALLPEGQPGCSLLTTLDILMPMLPDAAGVARSEFALADDPSLLGVQFQQQSVPLELDLSGAITAIRASNALALSIGTL